MTTKQKVIIASVIIGIILIAVIVIVKSKSKELNTTTESTEYAINESTEATEEVEEEDVDIVPESEKTTEKSTPTDTYSVTFTYNTTKDKNADSDELSNRTISINGNLITFPTDYKTLASIFELTPTATSRELGTITDATSISNTVDFYATPENVGIIQFYFDPVSNDDNSLTNAICNKVVISAISETNEPLTSMALKGGISFGSSKQDIINAYGKITASNEGSDDGQDFTLVYEPDDKSHDKYTFMGKNGGLYQIILKFGTE